MSIGGPHEVLPPHGYAPSFGPQRHTDGRVVS